MFCPGCGYQASDDLKYCRQCGANLRGVREAITLPHTEEKPDWSNSLAANILLAKQIKEQMRGTPEERRLNEIKGGVITSFVGIGLMIFLYFFLNVVANQVIYPHEAEILRSVWMVGIIPFLIGIGIIFNGLIVSRRLLQPKEQEAQSAKHASLTLSANPTALPAKTTDQLSVAPTPAEYSVTEEPTEHFPEPAIEPSHRKSGS
ncbi:MAG: zinc ribbon domain-containing protein [Acidobacteria bacterium]|nr:zinc ribbon domain-containing protein [Acidobacteriota bacterium]